MTPKHLFSLAEKINTPRETIVLAACDCARTVLHLVPKGEDRPPSAIEAAEQWARSPTEKNRKKAKEAADVAYAAAYAANAAGYAAAYAAARAADAAAYVANAAARAADAATNAAYAAANAAYAAANAATKKAYDEAYAKHEKLCCELIMKRIPRLEQLMVLK